MKRDAFTHLPMHLPTQAGPRLRNTLTRRAAAVPDATHTGASAPILPLLKAGGVLKFSPHTQRFFVIQHSREVPVDQAQARRLATSPQVRPSGVDSHGLYVFALNAAGVNPPASEAKGA